MQKSDLDTIVEQSLRLFYQDIRAEWFGRENELINLYALGRLAKCVRPNTILGKLTQLGIEVAVRQLLPDKKHKGRRSTVRKDLVIWPRGGMNLWKANVPYYEPLAVMEWKVNHFLNRAVHAKNRREHQDDIQWLRETSLRSGMSHFIGYAVLIENTRKPKELHATSGRYH